MSNQENKHTCRECKQRIPKPADGKVWVDEFCDQCKECYSENFKRYSKEDEAVVLLSRREEILDTKEKQELYLSSLIYRGCVEARVKGRNPDELLYITCKALNDQKKEVDKLILGMFTSKTITKS